MKKISVLGMILALGLALASNAMAKPTIFPTGITIYEPKKAFNGYTLVNYDYENVYAYVDSTGKGIFNIKKLDYSKGWTPPAVGNAGISLMDMNGNVVNTWEHASNGKKSYLLENGNLLTMSEDTNSVIEYDWDGNKIWEYQTKLGPHHDLERLANGNTLILCYEQLDINEVKKLPASQTRYWDTKKRNTSTKMYGDSIIEVDQQGKVVWSWLSSEHFDLEKYNPGMNLDDWTHGNTVNTLPENKWYDKGDKRFKPGNIIFNPRHFNQFFIIDKDSGKIVWESPKDFKVLGGLFNPHEPYMIPKGYPGAGNIMIFDNGNAASSGIRNIHSVVWEFRPDNFEVVWRYATAGPSIQKFHSMVKGTAYKLPNGNVIISEDMGSRAFQVKPNAKNPDGGDIVWEYASPHGLSRTQVYSYNHAPQTKALGKPKEMKVSPMDPIYFKVLPDELRKDGKVTTYEPKK